MWVLILGSVTLSFILVIISVTLYNIYLYSQLKISIDNNTINNNKIKNSVENIINLIDIDHVQNDNIFTNIKDQIKQLDNLITDLNNTNTSDHLLFDKKIFEIIVDKNTNWNYGNQLQKYEDFENWPTRMAFIDTNDTFRPFDIMNHEALGIKITSANTISATWIIFSLENNILYTKTKNVSGEITEWKNNSIKN